MPIYEYRCDRGHIFEAMQRMTDDPLTSCSTCDAAVQRVFHPVAVHFKGSGFYATDYGRKNAGAGQDSGEAPKEKASDSSTGSGTDSESKKSPSAGDSGSKPAAKSD